nr:hypothetical protein HK105_003931 [Polyrhizophydium stewartii]
MKRGHVKSAPTSEGENLRRGHKLKPVRTKRCPGCGSKLQTRSPDEKGYIPESALEQRTMIEPEEIVRLRSSKSPLTPGQVKMLLDYADPKRLIPICQRCHNLRHHNEAPEPEVAKTDNSQFKELKAQSGGLVVVVVDAFSLPSTLLPQLHEMLGFKKMIIAINRTRNTLGKHAVEIVPVSAKTGYGIDNLLAAIARHRNRNEDVITVGVTNVGKSALINSIIQKSGNEPFLTSSTLPGTTMNPIPIPLNTMGKLFFPNANSDAEIAEDTGRLVDTAGAYSPNLLTNFLSAKDIEILTPSGRMGVVVQKTRVATYTLVAGLVRIFTDATYEPTKFYFFGSKKLNLHRCRPNSISRMIQKHLGVSEDFLTPPTDRKRALMLPDFKPACRIIKRYELGTVRVWLGGIGWFEIHGAATVTVFTPGGVGVAVESLNNDSSIVSVFSSDSYIGPGPGFEHDDQPSSKKNKNAVDDTDRKERKKRIAEPRQAAAKPRKAGESPAAETSRDKSGM